ncbi:peptide/nickel transport system substrate-binding protein [Geosporobacter subterraneus DSM 17957]|uniref:Peptide/nickel transport system substrate-binding protein n=1 Tax=Geosporobacter subterraneus DSM 17957 TaxID=1121919 RepID=A0A1M6HHL2_9FIRM|nr:peptide ABC transporter substrate-binding protein [Geosporobacter subterraneus]SHJ21671.1 peptide/nickel transport system substrate-binding protein [Geosporobacter subterraneus DSM 17957]
MKKRRFMFCIYMLLIILMFIGCEEVEDIQNVEESMNTPKKINHNNELLLPLTKFETLNPIINTDNSVYHLSMLIYDGLLKLDSHQQPQPALATAWEISADAAVWTFTLRNNIKWHDGKPFTAEDVKFTIDALKMGKSGKDTSIYAFYTDRIKEAKVVQGNKVTIVLDSGANAYAELFTFPILPKHKFKTIQDVYTAKNLVPLGTGRYKVSQYNRSRYLKLVSNPDYWEGQPSIRTIIAQIVPDKETALTSLEANEVALAKSNDFDWEKYSEDPTLKIYEYVTQEFEFLGYNFRKELLQNKNLRQAIAYGIDRQALINDIYLGHATVSDVPINPDSWLYDENEKKYGYDVSRAKDILAKNHWEAKYPDPYLVNAEGQKLSMHLLVNSENHLRLRAAEMIKNHLKEVGIEIIIDRVSWEEYQNRLYSGNFDMVLGGWQLSTVPDLSFALHSASGVTNNFVGYNSPEMDHLLITAAMAKDEIRKREAYSNIQKNLVEELPYFGLFFKNSSIIMRDYVGGDINPKSFNIFNNIENWEFE